MKIQNIDSTQIAVWWHLKIANANDAPYFSSQISKFWGRNKLHIINLLTIFPFAQYEIQIEEKAPGY